MTRSLRCLCYFIFLNHWWDFIFVVLYISDEMETMFISILFLFGGVLCVYICMWAYAHICKGHRRILCVLFYCTLPYSSELMVWVRSAGHPGLGILLSVSACLLFLSSCDGVTGLYNHSLLLTWVLEVHTQDFMQGLLPTKPSSQPSKHFLKGSQQTVMFRECTEWRINNHVTRGMRGDR